MKLVVCLPEGGEAWARSLSAALPQAKVSLWQAGAEAADYALVWHPPVEFFAEQPGLKAAFSAGAGVDAFIDRVPKGLPLYRMEDAGMGALMAEYVLHALLRWHRRFDRYEQQREWQPLRPERREDWTVGVLGCGVLGQAVARAVQGLGFPVRGWVRTERPQVRAAPSPPPEGVKNPGGGPADSWPREADIPLWAGLDALPDFLAGTRVLVALLPLTDATRGLLNAERLRQLPHNACLINIARGGLLVQEDLIEVLNEGHLHAAMLDVTTPEPLPPEHPLWQHPRVTITPHVAALTPREPAMAQVAEKIRRLAQGEAVSGRVGPAGY